MAQVGFLRNITTEWVKLSELVSIESDKTYYIQNRGSDFLLTLEPDGEPDDNNVSGDMWAPGRRIIYEPGKNELYVRAYSTTCSINISVKG